MPAMPRAVILVTVLVLAACSGGTGADPTTSAAPTEPSTTTAVSLPSTTVAATSTSGATTSTTEPAPRYELVDAFGEPPVVTVLDPGAEPRRVLAPAFVVGDTTTSDIESSFTTDQRLNDEPVVSSELSQSFSVQTTVVEALDDGHVIETTVLEVSVETNDSRVQRTLEQLFAFLPGVSTYALTAADGSVLRQDVSQMTDFLNASAQNLDLSSIAALVPPLPAEPVGVGAVWTVETEFVQELLSFRQVTTYTLTDRAGDVVTLDVTIGQVVQNPETLGVGLEGAEVAYVAAGTGSIEIDLAGPVRINSSTTLTQSIDISGEAEGEAIAYVTENVIGLTVVTP